MTLLFIKDILLDEQVRVELISFPSTGYQWQVEEVDGLQYTRTWESREPQFKVSKKSRVGTLGVDVFKVSFNKPGKYTLCFKYKRPWEDQEIDTAYQAYRVLEKNPQDLT